MNRLITVLGGAAAVAVAGAALAAGSNRHVMNVPLADGTVVHVEYVGDVPPKVTVAPGGIAGPAWAPTAFPAFPAMPDMGRMIEQLNRQTAAMAQQVQQMARQPGVGPANLAAYGSVPAGANSVSVVSVSNGAGTCTRTTRVVSQGAGQPPRVTTDLSGNCAAGPAVAPAPSVPAPGAAPGRAPAALDHT